MEYIMDKTLKFEFTIEQTNMVLAALGRMPYETVAPMIMEVQKQAQAQLPQNGQAMGPNPDGTVSRTLPKAAPEEKTVN
jgi:hypothetical protein